MLEKKLHQRNDEEIKEPLIEPIKAARAGNAAASQDPPLNDLFNSETNKLNQTMTCPLKVFLKSNSGRFLQMYMQIEGTNTLVIQDK